MPNYVDSFVGIAPTVPDFHKCNPFYGENIPYIDCMTAFRLLPSGSAYLTYIVNPTAQQRSSNPFVLPFSKSHGNCLISIEVNGPSVPNTWSLSPDYIRGMAGWVVTQCISGSGGMGGFVTKGFLGMLEFLIDNPTLGPNNREITPGLRDYPPSSAFLTLTISSSSHKDPQTGNRDPTIAGTISSWAHSAYDRSLEQQDTFPKQFKSFLLKAIEKEFYGKAMLNNRGQNSVWSSPSSTPPYEMTYLCDASLGAPSSANCSNIDYSLFGAPSDTVMIGPGSPKVLTLGSCSVAVSAASSIVITWNQIKLALEGLLLYCVSTPWQSPIGGRAYFGPQVSPAFGVMKRDATNLTSLNALPPGVNLTAYQSGHYTPD